MPMVKHPYYTMWNELEIQYRLNQDGKNKVSSINRLNEVDFLFEDLFQKEMLFPELKSLWIKYHHNFEHHQMHKNVKKLLQYQYIFNSPFLKNLEHLRIEDNDLNTSWRNLKLITPDLMPNLKTVQVPIHAICNISKKEALEIEQNNTFKLKLFNHDTHLNHYE